jgi:hypothetical protein
MFIKNYAAGKWNVYVITTNDNNNNNAMFTHKTKFRVLRGILICACVFVTA